MFSCRHDSATRCWASRFEGSWLTIFLIDVQRVFAFSCFEVVFPECEIILNCATQQTTFGIEVSEVPDASFLQGQASKPS